MIENVEQRQPANAKLRSQNRFQKESAQQDLSFSEMDGSKHIDKPFFIACKDQIKRISLTM